MTTPSEPPIPKYALWKGQRLRVLRYHGGGLFWCLDKRDEKRLLHRKEITFIKGSKK